MFNSLLRALMQTFFYVCLSMWTTLMAAPSSNGSASEGTTNLILAIVTLLFTIAFSIFSYRFLQKNFSSLPNDTFKVKYDSLYQNLDYYNLKTLPHTLWFLMRRLAFSALIVFATHSIVIQVLLADILSTLLLVFFSRVRPMINWLNNAIQIFNEVVVLVSVWLMFHFTEFVT